MSAKREIKIYINSVRYEVEAALFSDDDVQSGVYSDTQTDEEPERMQIKTLGTFELDGDRANIFYEETELTGMNGSRTEISFDIRQGGIVTMARTGGVSTALVFEKGKRHHCVYNTPYMPFEVCVHTLEVNNRIADAGLLELDYIVEIRGARAERNKFSMRISG